MITKTIDALRQPGVDFWADDFLHRCKMNNHRFSAADEIERLQAELEEARKTAADEYELASRLLATFERDAMRYQWLRQQHWSTGSVCVAVKPEYSIQNTSLVISGDRMDRVVDIEMEREGGKAKA